MMRTKTISVCRRDWSAGGGGGDDGGQVVKRESFVASD